MTLLSLVGFLALLFIAAYLTFAAAASAVGSFAFSGKVFPVSYIFAVLAVAAWYLVVDSWPFQLVVKVGAA